MADVPKLWGEEGHLCFPSLYSEEIWRVFLLCTFTAFALMTHFCRLGKSSSRNALDWRWRLRPAKRRTICYRHFWVEETHSIISNLCGCSIQAMWTGMNIIVFLWLMNFFFSTVMKIFCWCICFNRCYLLFATPNAIKNTNYKMNVHSFYWKSLQMPLKTFYENPKHY